MPSSSSKFSGLMDAPKPLPASDDEAPMGESSRRSTSASRTTKATTKSPSTNERRAGQPKVPPAAPLAQAEQLNVVAPKASPVAATTVRLRPSAAEPLNAAWLEQRRRNDPKLSYPEFASRIVSLGLAAYEQQKTS